MSEMHARSDLKSRLIKRWEAQTEKPRPVILLASPGKDHGDEVKQAADELAIQYIRLHLQQVVTPEQHGLFTQDKPRLVAISGIDRLTPGERDALVRLTSNGPRSLVVILCQVEPDIARKIMAASKELCVIEKTQEQRAALMGKGKIVTENGVASGGAA